MLPYITSLACETTTQTCHTAATYSFLLSMAANSEALPCLNGAATTSPYRACLSLSDIASNDADHVRWSRSLISPVPADHDMLFFLSWFPSSRLPTQSLGTRLERTMNMIRMYLTISLLYTFRLAGSGVALQETPSPGMMPAPVDSNDRGTDCDETCYYFRLLRETWLYHSPCPNNKFRADESELMTFFLVSWKRESFASWDQWFSQSNSHTDGILM